MNQYYNKCICKTNNNLRCKNNKIYGNYCKVHYSKLENNSIKNNISILGNENNIIDNKAINNNIINNDNTKINNDNTKINNDNTKINNDNTKINNNNIRINNDNTKINNNNNRVNNDNTQINDNNTKINDNNTMNNNKILINNINDNQENKKYIDNKDLKDKDIIKDNLNMNIIKNPNYYYDILDVDHDNSCGWHCLVKGIALWCKNSHNIDIKDLLTLNFDKKDKEIFDSDFIDWDLNYNERYPEIVKDIAIDYITLNWNNKFTFDTGKDEESYDDGTTWGDSITFNHSFMNCINSISNYKANFSVFGVDQNIIKKIIELGYPFMK